MGRLCGSAAEQARSPATPPVLLELHRYRDEKVLQVWHEVDLLREYLSVRVNTRASRAGRSKQAAHSTDAR
jgi:hypothetical protein